MLAAIVLSHEIKILATVGIAVVVAVVQFGPAVASRLQGWIKHRRSKSATSRDVASRIEGLERRVAALESQGRTTKLRTTRKKGGSA